MLLVNTKTPLHRASSSILPLDIHSKEVNPMAKDLARDIHVTIVHTTEKNENVEQLGIV